MTAKVTIADLHMYVMHLGHMRHTDKSRSLVRVCGYIETLHVCT